MGNIHRAGEGEVWNIDTQKILTIFTVHSPSESRR